MGNTSQFKGQLNRFIYTTHYIGSFRDANQFRFQTAEIPCNQVGLPEPAIKSTFDVYTHTYTTRFRSNDLIYRIIYTQSTNEVRNSPGGNGIFHETKKRRKKYVYNLTVHSTQWPKFFRVVFTECLHFARATPVNYSPSTYPGYLLLLYVYLELESILKTTARL